MTFTILMVLYVVLAVFMIGFILIQRGAGAAAGSGFGAGASATVFGARGASSFLTKATKWLAIAFFILTLGMAIYVQRSGLTAAGQVSDDLGVMSGVAAPAAETPAPAADPDVPPAPQSAAPATAAPTDVPAAPPAETDAEQPATPPAEERDDGGN